jgi:hypothetical protein
MVSKDLVTVAAFASVFLVYCKPAPAPTRNQERLDSSTAGSEAPPTIVTSSLTGVENSTSSALVTSPGTDAKQVMDTSINAPGLQCAPTVITRRDTITLRMENPHGEYLEVTQPNGTLFYLIYPHPREPPNYLLMSSEAFTEMPTIRFLADVRSKPRIYGRDTLEPVFQEPGKYVLMIGSNLESERGSQIHKCTIRLVTQKQ